MVQFFYPNQDEKLPDPQDLLDAVGLEEFNRIYHDYEFEYASLPVRENSSPREALLEKWLDRAQDYLT